MRKDYEDNDVAGGEIHCVVFNASKLLTSQFLSIDFSL